MRSQSNANEYLEAARSEDLQSQEVKDLSVVADFERRIIDSLKSAGAHLLQGARGVGKSTLLRYTEIELDATFRNNRVLGVYVNFKTSTLLEGIAAGQKSAFQIWVNTKILQALHEKLIVHELLSGAGTADPYKQVFGIASVEKTGTFLTEKLHQLQKLAFADDKDAVLNEIGSDFLDKLFDPASLSEVLKDVVRQFHLERIVFLFDEAAHTFIPSQQETFFEIFKLVHGGIISCKAAVYPTVTSYGRNFEVGQDAIVLPLDRYDPAGHGKRLYRSQFRDIVDKRLPKASRKRKDVFGHGEVLDLCIDVSSGNPRAFLHILNATLSRAWNDRAVSLAAQDYVERELLPYHANLAKRLPKYAAHVNVGLDLLRGYIVPEIAKKNRSKSVNRFQAAFFAVPGDLSPNLRLALDIMCYSGILINKGTVKNSAQKTSLRYMVNIALLINERAFFSAKIKESLDLISLRDYREFSSNDTEIQGFLSKIQASSESCVHCSANLTPNAKFCSACGKRVEKQGSIIAGLLDEPTQKLSVSEKLIQRVSPEFPKVGDVVQATREELMRVQYIKEVRSRMIKNAADEFISG
ncbi:zinc ribbon domain-containing protein [Burkholderia catarinensis]|uniref:zinc ribbon domain-containing protein n=1 Tax=Burkholderia catarinensis TaxID=1108140 RepID=UPI000917C327|nr:zinc ribbon domain-containing protein [Burkholderia catarinensis]KAG8153419.1 zinc ribbon domain-containing protein [Burkholderia catarinensis]